MAEILGKDLEQYDNSDIANAPFNLVESEIAGPRFMTGKDLSRSAKISAEWKKPIAIPTQAKGDRTVVEEISSSFLTGASDAVANMPANARNTVAQTYLESGILGNIKRIADVGAGSTGRTIGEGLSRLLGYDVPDDKNKDKLDTYDKVVDILEGRIYPLDKYARRVIANATDSVESRKIVRELYNQAQGIDSSKLYNQGATILGAMTPALVLTKGAYGAGRAFGASRIAATNLATNIAKSYIGAEMGGQYAEETAAQYRERTGDMNFENFTAKDAKGLSAIAYGAIGAQIEFIGGVEPIVAGALNKVGLRSGLLSAGLKIGAGEATEEFLQGITETLMRKIDNTSDKTWAEGFKEALQGAAWGAVIGGGLGTTTFYANRRNLVKGIKTALPNISEEEAKLVADAMIDSTAEMASQNPTLRSKLREKVAMMYRDSDIDNKEQNIDAITDLEYSLITMDAAERGVELSEHELFGGVVNELGWFRKGIPENRIAEVQALNDEIKSLKDELAKENAQEEKNWEKIDELETKLAQANQYILDKISDLARDDAMSIRRMLRNTEAKFVKKEKERATKKAIKSGNVDIISDYLSKAGFKMRDMSGTQVKELARLNWELLQDKDLGQSQLRGTVQRKLADIEANVEDGNAVLLRAGYTQEMIDKMDDETWNRAILTQYRKEMPATDEGLVPDEALEDLPDDFFQEEVFSMADENTRLDDIYPEYTGETINIDGKERTVYNSNGDRIAKSKEALTNFWRWFGDSKVVDEEGRPLVVYHGTSAEFNEFLGEKIGQSGTSEGVGFYFTPDENIAKGYGNTMSLYLKLEKPVYAYSQVFLAEDYDGDLDIMEANAEMIQDASMQVLEDLKAKGYEFYDETTSQMADIYTETDYDTLTNTIEMYIKDGIKTEEYDENKLYNDIRESIINNFGFDGFKTKNYANTSKPVYVALMSNQIKSVDNRGTFSSDTGNIYLQNRTSGAAPKDYRGAYIPAYRFIQRSNRMDASTLSHELAHDWMEVNFDRFRSGEATPDFMRSWGALEKALGIEENATQVPRQASETFARAYEAWITSNPDWSKFIAVEDKDKDKVEKLLQDYQGELRNIYNDINNKYFKDTWGKLGELKPELKAWFDRVVNIIDLDVLVERGELTPAQAENEKLNRAIDTVIESTTDEDATKELRKARLLNDTNRYEVEGGNQNSLQNRLSVLAREIDDNNITLKGEKYNTHRDMMQVAEAADNFVKTRLEDALAIINGEMAEVEGLYKEDIYTALERLAVETGDMNLISELKNSEIANQLAKELGQRVAGFRNWKQSNEIDVFSALKSLDNNFNKALKNKKAQKQFDSALDLLDESLQNQDKVADKQLDSMLKELECQ